MSSRSSTRLTLSLPLSLAPRVQRAAEMRGLTMEEYVVTLLQWHSPAYDNDAQYLKAKVREALDASPGDDEGATMNAVRALVGD